MFRNVLIKKSSIYVPKKKVTNEFFIEHFHGEDKECEGLLKAHNRNIRRFAKEDESSLTMAIEAVDRLLDEIDRCSIDMLVFVSVTPEYTAPTNAIKIVDKLGLDKAYRILDMNDDCTGMLDAIYLVNNTMIMDKKVNRAVIVGAEIFSVISNYHDTAAYPTFGDGASAILLEAVEENTKRGFIDFEFYNMPEYNGQITFPQAGLSKVLMKKPKNREKRLEWLPFNTDFIPDKWEEMISDILQRNALLAKDIDGWCMSQLLDRDNKRILEELDADMSKYVYIGDLIGYTGCTSPIFAYHSGQMYNIENGHIVFNSVAVGCHFVTILYKN